jgi:flagellar operon protein (TIGR03826 family)
MPIANCKKCGAVFSKSEFSICPKCLQEEEAEFQQAINWVRENPGKTTTELSNATGIEIGKVLKWIREQRLKFSGANGMIVCMKCGKNIESGSFCESCKSGLSHDIGQNAQGSQTQGGTTSSGMHYTSRRRRR